MHRPENLLLKGVSHAKAYCSPVAKKSVLPERTIQSTLVFGVLLTLTLLCGVLFYLVYRSDGLYWLLQQFPQTTQSSGLAVNLPPVPAVVYHSFPSLIGGMSIVFFIALLRPVNRYARRVALTGSMVTLIVFEALLGYFHWLDVAATVLGLLAGLCITCLCIGHLSWQSKRSPDNRKTPFCLHKPKSLSASKIVFPTSAAVLFSSLLAIGSTFSDGYYNEECARFSEEGYCQEYKRAAIPVYMSFANLRSSVAVESPRAPDRIGRLYLYADYVFLNEVNEGIHIIDNTDPTMPVNMAFIRIPGNTEIAVRDNILYADSYVDFLTIDISNPQTATIVSRQEFIFPYDEYQNIPQNITFSGNTIERDQGVVVSYRLGGS